MQFKQKILAWYRPQNADMRRISTADGFRSICVLLVGWFHIWQLSWMAPVLKIGSLRLNFNAPVRTGYMFVDFMLLLSGFLLLLQYALQYEKDGSFPSTATFYKKRMARILPSYWLSLAVVLIVLLTTGNTYPSARQMFKDIAAHLTFTHNLFPDTLSTPLNGVLWTLAVEVQFYLLFPLIGRWFVKRPLPTYLLMVGAAFAYRQLWVMNQADTAVWVNRLPAMLDVYANGMLACLIYLKIAKKKDKPVWQGILWTLGAVVCAVLIYYLLKGQAALSPIAKVRIGQLQRRFAFSALGSLFILCSAFSVGLMRWVLSNKLMRWCAGISFQFYIWHQYIAAQMISRGFPPSVSPTPNQVSEQPWQTQYVLIWLAATLGISSLLTYAFEQPIAKRLSARFIDKPKNKSGVQNSHAGRI